MARGADVHGRSPEFDDRDADRSRLPLAVTAIRLGVPLGVLEQAARSGALRVVHLGPARVPCTAPVWIGDWAAGRVRRWAT